MGLIGGGGKFSRKSGDFKSIPKVKFWGNKKIGHRCGFLEIRSDMSAHCTVNSQNPYCTKNGQNRCFLTIFRTKSIYNLHESCYKICEGFTGDQRTSHKICSPIGGG